MSEKICQSCGMPLNMDADFGKNANGTFNEDYCHYCYSNGNFTQDITMEQMIQFCSQFVEEFNKDSPQKLTREEAIEQMKIYFPKLKRWANT